MGRVNIPVDQTAPADPNDDLDADSLIYKIKGFNRYALACAILASTNSVLLGYGKNNLSLIIFTFFN